MFWLLTAALVAVLAALLYVHPANRPPRETTYIVLVRTFAPTPSETVTPWDAYEAAPQRARTPGDAIHAFAHDSGLHGEMKAIPLDDWNHKEAR